jgi:hypothetical protein
MMIEWAKNGKASFKKRKGTAKNSKMQNNKRKILTFPRNGTQNPRWTFGKSKKDSFPKHIPA